VTASTVGSYLAKRPSAMRAQLWFSGAVLGIFAVNILVRKPFA
jgi:threonine/homoserine/homoserine lactone efflux protein